MRCAALVVLVLGGCGAPPAERAASGGALVAPTLGERGPGELGMNDISVLLPLPRELGSPVLAMPTAEAPLIDRRWFDALVARGDIAPRTDAAIPLDEFHVVALRVDLCDRETVGACPRDATGRLRLVLQPLYKRAGETFAHDVALHAFYALAPDELGAVIGELRGLARRHPVAAPLTVSPAAVAGDAAYLDGLRRLVLREARPEKLVRLTVIGQVANSAAFAWIFRGLDRVGNGDGFAPLVIPGIAAAQQTALLAGGDTVYQVDPLVDAPAGFRLALNGPLFAAAAPEARAAAVAALAEVQNPTRHDSGDTQCIGCHVATYLTARRAATSHIDPTSLAGWFAPAAPGVRSIAGEDPRVVRAFGWAGNRPAISQRVVNDTTAVLAEIAARFPARVDGAPSTPGAPPVR